jgi:hypothetical protein
LEGFPSVKAPLLAALALVPVLAGCASRGEIDATGGITAVRSACPTAAVPAATGDITMFDPATSRDASAIDVVATLSNLRATCNDTGDQITTQLTFDVLARRARTEGPRDLVLPVFVTLVRGGSAVVAKRVEQVSVHFDAGQPRAQASGQGTTYVARSAATLPEDVRRRLTRRRKAGEQDAAVDPLTQPEVRQAVARASFEALVGFQLTDDQLRYNATR